MLNGVNIGKTMMFKEDGCVSENSRKNHEGYSDPTAYEAIKNMEVDDERFHKLLNTIFTICELSGFHLEERIVLKDTQTGKVWR